MDQCKPALLANGLISPKTKILIKIKMIVPEFAAYGVPEVVPHMCMV